MTQRRQEASAPIILVVSSDAGELVRIGALLERRFGQDYEIVAEGTAASGIARLTRLRDEGRAVAVVLALPRLDGMSGADFLASARDVDCGAKLALLVEWAEAWGRDPETTNDLVRGSVLGQFDAFVLTPHVQPDEQFYAAIGELLEAWARRQRPVFEAVQVVGEQWSHETHELRDMLERSSIPFAFAEADSREGRALLATIGIDGPFPIAVFHDGRVLVQPTAIEIASAIGINVTQDDTTYDLVVVGAGPAGLAAAVGGASEGLRVLVIEPVAHGGQAGTSSMIRNYLGFPSGIAGADLAALAYRQAYSFGAKFLFGRRATGLRTADGIHLVTLDDGTEVHGRAVMLATGVSYRRVGVDRLDGLLGRGVYYGAATTEAPAMRGEDVFVVGGANSAGQAAVFLARFARSVTLLIRGKSLAEGMSDYLVSEIGSLPNITVLTGTEVVDAQGDQRLGALTLRDRTSGVTREVPAGAVFVLIGAIPATDWLPAEIRRDESGFVLTGERAGAARSAPSPFETSVPGVFAAGDVRADSTKRVASAVGEGSGAIRYVHAYLAEADRVELGLRLPEKQLGGGPIASARPKT